ncbi:MAG: sterol desaturase family protein [Bacteroidetes bacterium]|nr:sterol desaturase family protein [Bacteroidota bacterium]
MELYLEGIAYYVYPVLIFLIIAEYLSAKHLYNLKESLSSVTIAGVSSLIAVFTKVWALGVFYLVFEFSKEFRIEYLGYESLGWAWYAWLVVIIADDFSFYWHHRLSHSIRILWAAHSPHHNADSFNLSVGIRNGWFITLYKPVFWLWMAIIGFEPVMIAMAMIFNGIFQFFLHSQLVPSLGWIGKIINNAYVHTVHHSSNVEYLDKNHGGILLIWDRIFGTYVHPIKGLENKFGVLKPPPSLNPITANTHEFVCIWKDMKRAPTWKDKIKYIFYPPGWSHDGSSLTTRQMQAAYAVKIAKMDEKKSEALSKEGYRERMAG